LPKRQQSLGDLRQEDRDAVRDRQHFHPRGQQ
jgi:hypothetical protein